MMSRVIAKGRSLPRGRYRLYACEDDQVGQNDGPQHRQELVRQAGNAFDRTDGQVLKAQPITEQPADGDRRGIRYDQQREYKLTMPLQHDRTVTKPRTLSAVGRARIKGPV